MNRILPLLLALATAAPVRAADASLESFAAGAFGAASAFGARLGARAAEKAKEKKPEVELWVYNTEDGPSPDGGVILDASTRIDHALTGASGAKLVWVKDGAALKKELEKVRDSGARIKKLVFLAHGASGLTTLVDDSNLRDFKGVDSAFAPGAKVEMRSCSVASDEPGAAFVERFGSTFLASGGGSVDAAKGTYVGLPVVGGCPWGTCTVTVDPGGCARVTKGYDLAAEKTKLTERIDAAQAKLDAAAARLGPDRTGRLNERLDAARGLTAVEPWTMNAVIKSRESVDLAERFIASSSKLAPGAQTSGR